jgi:hypothetical protein
MNPKRKGVYVLDEALQELGVYRSFTASKLKDGTRVWRRVGDGYRGLKKHADGKIYLWRDEDHGGPIEITAEHLELDISERENLGNWSKADWHLVNHGAEKIEAHLKTAMEKAGYQVEVKVGGDGSYPTSIAVYERKSDVDKQLIAVGLTNPAVTAIAAITGALMPLNDEERKRVIEWVMR